MTASGMHNTNNDSRKARSRVALVHDWLTGMRGGEKALEAVCELYPKAELYTLLHKRKSVSPVIENRSIHRSFIQYLPFSETLYRYYLPFFPGAIELFDLDSHDLIISTSHCVAKSAVKTGRAFHVCYCFTPMRYAREQFDDYFGAERVGNIVSGLMLPFLNSLARWDTATSGRVDLYIAISQHVADRIQRYYNRSAKVVYPPVDTNFYSPNNMTPEDSFVVVSALVPYKRIDLAIRACKLSGMKLRIVGDGPDLNRLRQFSNSSIEFLGPLTNDAIRDLYRSSKAMLLPGEEEFGIASVEAQACGCPVIALKRGGAVETVVDGETGILVNKPTVEAFAEALNRAHARSFNQSITRKNAERFSATRFRTEFKNTVDEALNLSAKN